MSALRFLTDLQSALDPYWPTEHLMKLSPCRCLSDAACSLGYHGLTLHGGDCMEPREGVEPTAYCLQSSCTTIVLSRQFGIDRVSLLHEDLIVAVDARWDTCPSKIGGEGGFRSPMSFRTSVFKTDAFADSATSP